MTVYTIELGYWLTMDEGPNVNKPFFTAWIELQLFDDTGPDKWIASEDRTDVGWPVTGEWTRSPSNRRVTLRRRDAGARLAQIWYDQWPLKKGMEGKVELDETFDGTKQGAYIVKSVD